MRKKKFPGTCRRPGNGNRHTGRFAQERVLTISDKKIENDYKNDVVKRILGDLTHYYGLEPLFYELRPAFAVFLKYLNEKEEKTGEKKKAISDFRDELTFRAWLKKRLAVTLNLAGPRELDRRPEYF